MSMNPRERPVRQRLINPNLTPIYGVNEAALESTTYYFPSERRRRGSQPSRSETSSPSLPPLSSVPSIQRNSIQETVWGNRRNAIDLEQRDQDLIDAHHSNRANQVNSVGLLHGVGPPNNMDLPNRIQTANEVLTNGVMPNGVEMPNGTHLAPRASSSEYSQDSGISLHDHTMRSGNAPLDEEDLAYDPYSTYDMVRETESFLDLQFREIQRSLEREWNRASVPLRSRMRRELYTLLGVWTILGAIESP
ncbi:hypothetical protein GTA08_BOTSDO13593 [Botryosphaeria dothidea]|uniref:Uncharacterized protein n=1 Tax=Botryosphaeria dothidea TaxID=55169 RepID=A0A8H4J2K5_9PEZI|nr:hypothetical protein GTA08_BOTSDO13593 [Botryosphaeria dothidea]